MGEKGSTLIIRGVGGGGGGGAGGRTGAGAGGGGGGGGGATFPLSLSFRSLCLLISSAAIYAASNSRPSSLGADLWFEYERRRYEGVRTMIRGGSVA